MFTYNNMPETGPNLIPNPEASTIKEEEISSQEKGAAQVIVGSDNEQKEGFTNAEELVKDFFEKTTNSNLTSSSSWSWEYDSVNQIISMNLRRSDAIRYINPIEVDSLKIKKMARQASGIDNILKVVKGKNGRFFLYEDCLYLQLEGGATDETVQNKEDVKNSEAKIETLYGIEVDRDPKKLEGTPFKLDQFYERPEDDFYQCIGVSPEDETNIAFIDREGDYFFASPDLKNLVLNPNIEIVKEYSGVRLVDKSRDFFKKNNLGFFPGDKVVSRDGDDCLILGRDFDNFIIYRNFNSIEGELSYLDVSSSREFFKPVVSEANEQKESSDSEPAQNKEDVKNSEPIIETLYGVSVDRDPKKIEGTDFQLDRFYTIEGGFFYKFLGVDPKDPDNLIFIVDNGFAASIRSRKRSYFKGLIETNLSLEVLEINGSRYIVDTSPDSFEENGLDCRPGSKAYSFDRKEVIIKGLDANGDVFTVDSQNNIFTFKKNTPIALSIQELSLTPVGRPLYVGPQIEKKYGLKLGQKFSDGNRFFVFKGIDAEGDCALESTDEFSDVVFVATEKLLSEYSLVPENNEFLKHFEAKKAKADRFKESVQFQALMKLINSDPDLKEEYEVVVKRRAEFKNIQKSGRYITEDKIPGKDGEAKEKLLEERLSAIKGNERHRDYTAMLSAIMLSPRLRALMEPMLDHSTEEYSKQIKTRMEKGAENYVEEVVIGTGVYSTILATTRQMYFPENPSLSIEALHHTGGQFAEYGGDAFQLNSRTRPEQRGNLIYQEQSKP